MREEKRVHACGGGESSDGANQPGVSPFFLGGLMRGAIARFGAIVGGLLRELADESAYRRHLDAHGRVHSGEEWRRFIDARLCAKYTRPKCC